ncbi:MAG TPA: phosphoadenylyl-sulfate reductase [Bryobacteraceae bacterium]|jgi:phosphoadenosine phosphosulfate reductase
MIEKFLLRTAIAEAAGRACFTCSFQAEDVIVLHMLREVQPDIPVLFLETGYHFPELLEYRDRLVQSWGINLINVAAGLTRGEHEARFGRLYRTSPADCCRMRKVEPLLRALDDYSVWFTGLRREQSPTRAALRPAEIADLPSGRAILKINPLALWKWNELWSYLRIHEIPYAPLYDAGYTSIGCEPCTTPPTDPANARSGRWAGAKFECGIHTFGRPAEALHTIDAGY